jgi:hypothetical protein
VVNADFVLRNSERTDVAAVVGLYKLNAGTLNPKP